MQITMRLQAAMRAAMHHAETCKTCRVPVIDREAKLARASRLCEVGKALRAAVLAAEREVLDG